MRFTHVCFLLACTLLSAGLAMYPPAAHADPTDCPDTVGVIKASYSCIYTRTGDNFRGEPNTPSRRYCMLGAPCESDRKCSDGTPVARGYCAGAHRCKVTPAKAPQVNGCMNTPLIEETPATERGYAPAVRQAPDSPIDQVMRSRQPQMFNDPELGRVIIRPIPSQPSNTSSWLCRLFGC